MTMIVPAALAVSTLPRSSSTVRFNIVINDVVTDIQILTGTFDCVVCLNSVNSVSVNSCIQCMSFKIRFETAALYVMLHARTVLLNVMHLAMLVHQLS